MAITIGSLLIRLGLDSGEFKSGLTGAERQFRRTVRDIERSGRELQGTGERLTLGITAPLAALGATAIRGFMDQSRAIADVEAALRSMGGASGKTSAELNRTADALEMRSLFDADVILKQVTANLLTFGNVAGSVFDRAQQAAVDMATRLGGEPQAAAMQLGRALNDPVRGLTALTRAGVSFSAAQQQQIRAMTDMGRVAEAQGLILDEVERQFRGAAAAAADATPWRQAQVAINQAMDTIGEAALPALRNVADAVAGMARAFSTLSPEMQKAVVTGLALSAALGPVLVVVGSLVQSGAGAIAMFRVFGTATLAASAAAGSATPALLGLRAAVISLTASMGPWLLAAAAVAGAIYLLTRRTSESVTATEEQRASMQRLEEVKNATRTATERLAVAQGAARAAALAETAAIRDQTAEYLRNAQARLIAAQARQREASEAVRAQQRLTAGLTPTGGNLLSGRPEARGRAAAEQRAAAVELASSSAEVFGLTRDLIRLQALINAPAPAVGGAPAFDAAGGGAGGAGAGAGPGLTGPDPAEVERRFQDELSGYRGQIASARANQAMSAAESAELELRQVELARASTLRSLATDQEYSEVQRAQLALAIEALADEERDAVRFREAQQLERERADMAQIEFDRQREMLALRADVAETEAERRDLALEILALEQQYRRNQLELVLASATAADHEKARAQAILDSLSAIEAGEAASVQRRNETTAEAFRRNVTLTGGQISEQLDQIAINGLESLNSGLVDAMVNFRSLGDVARNVIRQILADLLTLQIRQAIIGPLSQALGIGGTGGGIGGGAGGGIGAIGTALGSLFGGPRADGGPVHSGRMYLVGERGPELFAPGRNGNIIPNDALRPRGGGEPVFNITVSGAMDNNSARRTGTQIGSAAAAQFARARRSGLAG